MIKKLYVALVSLGAILKSAPALKRIKKMDEDSIGRKVLIRKSIKECSSKIMAATGAKIHVKGIENIPLGETVLYMANHSSMIDIPLLYTVLPDPLVGFIAKISLKSVPIVSDWIKVTNGLFLDRKKMRDAIKTRNEEIIKLKNDHSLAVFADGTRKAEAKNFKSGSLRPAQEANVQVIPTAISGTDQVFNGNVKKSGIHITFLSPRYINPQDNINHLAKAIQNEIYEEKEKQKMLIKTL